MSAARRLILVLLSLGLSACFFGGGEKKCAKPQEYQESRSVRQIEVPEDLDESGIAPMRIPPVSDNAAEPPPDRPCLELPPSYSG